jgi:hypothetical protein
MQITLDTITPINHYLLAKRGDTLHGKGLTSTITVIESTTARDRLEGVIVKLSNNKDVGKMIKSDVSDLNVGTKIRYYPKGVERSVTIDNELYDLVRYEDVELYYVEV